MKRKNVSLNNLSIQKRISLFVIAGLVVGLGLFSWLGIQSLNENTQRTLDQRLAIARIMASRLDETLSHVTRHLQDVAALYQEIPTETEFGQAANSARQTFAESQISTHSILLTDRNGRVLRVDPDDARIIDADMAFYPEVAKSLKAGVPTISNLVTNSLMGAQVVLVTTPILSEDNAIIGALVSTIDIERSGMDAFDPGIQIGNTGYTEIVDGNGLVIARTEPGSPPRVSEMSDHPGRFAMLIREGKATVSTCHRCHETDNEQVQRRRDVLAFAPLSFASWGVAIRQSEEEALAPTQQLEMRLFLLGIVVLVGTFLLVWTIMQGIMKPIRMLTAAARRVATGDFKAAIPIRRQDEIGQLSAAFSTMTQELASSRDELITRNEELSALNSIAATVSQSLNLKDVLENALRKVMEVTRTAAGCVFLRDNEVNRLKMMFCTGLACIFECQESGLPASNCACHRVLHSGQTLMVNHASQCPMLDDGAMKDDVGGFVSVPLKSKNRTLGIMNVACSTNDYFTEDDFRLLDSIGYHIGLAIENSALYEEAKRKEKLRGQLLNSVISAQEEERKRISRELHDEYGQTLTGVIMGMEAMENMVSAGQGRLRGRLENVKSLVARALEDVRRLTFDLRPSTLDDLGLVSAIRTYVHTHLESRGIKVEFESKGSSERLPPPVETALFRILQEAIHNIVKHAQANNVRIRLAVNDTKITAIVEDDGSGFDVEAAFKSRVGTESLGLLGIQERAELLGGTFIIRSQPGHGTRIRVEVPAAGSPQESFLRSG